MDPIIHAAISATVGSTQVGWKWSKLWPYIFWGIIADAYQIFFLGLNVLGFGYFNNFYNQNFWFWYNPSHSLIIAIAVFFLVSVLRKQWYWPLSMWSLHIAFDIASHQNHLTPWLWPVSDFKFRGLFDYTRPLSLIITYGLALLGMMIIIWHQRQKSQR